MILRFVLLSLRHFLLAGLRSVVQGLSYVLSFGEHCLHLYFKADRLQWVEETNGYRH